MNLLELKIIDTLKILKEKYHICGIKTEFETEGTNLEENLRLKDIAVKTNLDLTIKISGCGSVRDMYDAKSIGINAMVAPMIESSYALGKYIQTAKRIFTEYEFNTIKFLVNIETISGFNCLDEILSSDYTKDLDGIVIGRTDMAESLNMSKNDVNHERIFGYTEIITKKALEYGKEVIIGGGVSAESLKFFNRLPEMALSKFETRKVIFDAQPALKNPDIDNGILKALEFELLWLKNKRETYGIIFKEDEIRLRILETRYKNLLAEVNKACV